MGTDTETPVKILHRATKRRGTFRLVHNRHFAVRYAGPPSEKEKNMANE
jgi:hypothetical protein